MVKQISVFIENKKGRLAELTGQLRENNIDLKALSIADTTNFGILRCIVDNPDLAIKVIRGAGFTANITEVLAVEVPDVPGGLSTILDYLAQADISVEYLYSFVHTQSKSALILFRVEEPEKAKDLLLAKGVRILTAEEVYSL
ncbi:MAG: ACT domain-containing protein [Bacillota bacterium]